MDSPRTASMPPIMQYIRTGCPVFLSILQILCFDLAISTNATKLKPKEIDHLITMNVCMPNLREERQNHTNHHQRNVNDIGPLTRTSSIGIRGQKSVFICTVHVCGLRGYRRGEKLHRVHRNIPGIKSARVQESSDQQATHRNVPPENINTIPVHHTPPPFSSLLARPA